jgi:hypothetical protein
MTRAGRPPSAGDRLDYRTVICSLGDPGVVATVER